MKCDINVLVPKLMKCLLQPPKALCLTKIWHPNITESGEICLSLLRQNSYDGLGWAPTRRLKDVLWGLNSLFSVSIVYAFSSSITFSLILQL